MMEFDMTAFRERMAAGEPLVKQAMDALCQYHVAREAMASQEELKRLLVQAEYLFQAVSDFQNGVLGADGATCH
ncbi:hypothetical protein [Pseudomonas sp. DG56-2]|uniref:hypothetical protein n=1 Tax=Pseudomonas sp. DG56-2 TaxID=2320270 RepID=UPI002113EC06|nr:hypothetical protein [Pseudomonas sp. DG56-2]